MRDTFELDRPYKQSKNTTNREDLVIQTKQKNWRWHTQDLPLTNSINGTARCSLTLKIYNNV